MNPLPVNTEVRVTIDGRIVNRVPRDEGGWLYYIEGTDGRKRWVPDYNVTPLPHPDPNPMPEADRQYYQGRLNPRRAI